MDCSIIICCYNSSARIEPTLKQLAKQSIGDLQCEVVLVNNNSNDNTVEVVNKMWTELNAPFLLKIIEEKEPGLSYARKAGIKSADGEIIVFCDDDNWLDENFIHNAYSLLSADKTIGAACGINMPKSDVEFPEWFYSFQINYAVGIPSLNSGDISPKGWIWGAGFVTRKSLLLNLLESGFSNYTTDRKGNSLSTGGDVEICKWFLITGYKLWFSDKLKLTHFIPAERLSLDYLKKLQAENIKLIELFSRYDAFISVQNAPKKRVNAILCYIKQKLGIKLSIYEKSFICEFMYGLSILDKNTFYYKMKKSLNNFKKIHKSN